ncbi:MAG: hypothetical protein RR550_00820 [Rikenellaceae bacterium]
MYVKDTSGSAGRDNALVKVIYSEKCWFTMSLCSYVNGLWKPSTWSEPRPFIADTKEQESIYKLTALESAPETPDSQPLYDDYVPTDWTDNPMGVSNLKPFEWLSIRYKKNGVWGAFSTSALFAKYSTDGGKGEDGDPAVSYNFISPVTSIRKNSLGFFEPSSFNVILKKSVGGVVMNSGDKYITVFGSESGSSWDRITNSVLSDSVTVTPQSRYNMYCVKATDGYNPSFGDTSYAMIGVNVVDGQMRGSFPRNCGEYKPATEYVYDADFRDCIWIKDGAISRVFMVRSFGNSLVGVNPLTDTSNPTKWVEGNVEQFTAINTALIDGADIAGFLFKDGILQSKDTNSSGVPNIRMNGETGEIIAMNAKISGEINAFAGIFGGMLQMKFKSLEDGAIDNGDGMNYTVGDCFNLSASQKGNVEYSLILPNPSLHEGATINISNTIVRTKSSPTVVVKGIIIHKDFRDATNNTVQLKNMHIVGGIIQLIAIENAWFVTYDNTLRKEFNYGI